MSDHKHGEMDTSVQEKTFDGFMNLVTKVAALIVVALILLAIIGG